MQIDLEKALLTALHELGELYTDAMVRCARAEHSCNMLRLHGMEEDEDFEFMEGKVTELKEKMGVLGEFTNQLKRMLKYLVFPEGEKRE